jgi:16S rRNA C1402 (ribose-2'-O) methylase RsmI
MTKSASTDPLSKTLVWLTANTGFPRSRLDSKAEILVCLAALAAEATRVSNAVLQKNSLSYDRAALKAHNMNRSHAHYKSDNSAKV